MLQRLLSDRFQLKVHPGTKEIPSYALVVAKSGPKMKESAIVPAPPENVPETRPLAKRPTPHLDANGFQVRPTIPAGSAGMDTMIGTHGVRLIGRQQTMSDLAKILGTGLRTSVTDETGLTAKYDFDLMFTPEWMTLPPGSEELPRVFAAVQSLGLKLEPRKDRGTTVETIVIDHIERKPTEN